MPSVSDANVKFLKTAISMGAIDKDAGKQCLRVLKTQGGEADAVAQALGFLDADGCALVHKKVEQRKKRKKRKKTAKKRDQPVSVESGILDSNSDVGSVSDSGSDEHAVTVRAPSAKTPVTVDSVDTSTPVTTGSVEDAPTKTPATTAAADDDDVAAEEAPTSDSQESLAQMIQPRRRVPMKIVALFAASAFAGTLTGIGGGVAYATSGNHATEVAQAPEIVIAKPAPTVDPDVIDLSEDDDDLGPDAIPSSGSTSGNTMTRRPKARADDPQPKAAKPKAKAIEPKAKPKTPKPKAAKPKVKVDTPAKPADVTRAREKTPEVAPETTLLWAVFLAFDQEKKKTLRKLEGQLRELNESGLERRAATGFSSFLEGDFPKAIVELEASKTITGARGRLALARAYMNDGQHKKALAQLQAADRKHPIGKRIVTIVEGPFRQKYPHAADALEAITPDGHYRVVSDLGLTTDYLAKLERDLASADERGRKRMVAKAKKAHQGLAEVCDTMDKAYKAYDKLFNVKRKGDVVPTVYVFSQRALFDGYSKALEIGATEHTLGYYVPYYRILVFYDMTKPGVKKKRGQRMLSQATLEVLLHETFHQWLHLYCNAPRWFDEGLAEYFGIATMTKKGLHYGQLPKRHPSRLSNIRDALRGQMEQPLPIEQLIQAERSVFYGEKKAINYAHAWSFVHFLASFKKGKKLLREYFKAMCEGKSLPQAYEDVFGDLDVVALEDKWREYVFNLKG